MLDILYDIMGKAQKRNGSVLIGECQFVLKSGRGHEAKIKRLLPKGCSFASQKVAKMHNLFHFYLKRTTMNGLFM